MRLLLIPLLAFWLAGCQPSTLTYEQLATYPTRCDSASEQLPELQALQRAKNFPSDPDAMSESDRLYNGLLKSTLWWYVYACGKS